MIHGAHDRRSEHRITTDDLSANYDLLRCIMKRQVDVWVYAVWQDKTKTTVLDNHDRRRTQKSAGAVLYGLTQAPAACGFEFHKKHTK